MGERDDGRRGGGMNRPRRDQRHGRSNQRRGGGGGQFYLPRGTVVFVLDILQHGGMDSQSHNWNPVAQIIEVPSFKLHEIALNKGKIVQLQDKVVLGGEDCPLGKVQKRLKYTQLTRTSIEMLYPVLSQYIIDNEEKFVSFLNAAGPITIKRHSLEELPGVGKKMMWDIVNARERELFKNFADINARVPGLKIPEILVRRIIEELGEEELKHYLFVKRTHHGEDQGQHRPLQHNPYSRRAPM